MKKRNKIILAISIVILSILVIAVVNTSYKNANKATINKMENQPISVKQKMTQTQMKADLDYLVTTLKEVHPKSYRGLSDEQQAIIKSSYEKIKTPMEVEDFYFIANEIVCSFKDAHTVVIINTNSKLKTIQLPLVWLHDGLYVSNNTEELRKGDKVVSIGSKSPYTLLEEFSKIVPSENDNWVKVRVTRLINKEPYLKHLGLINNNYVSLEIERNNKKLNMKLPLMEIDKKTSDSNEWVSYKIYKEKSLGVFKLDLCNNNDKYKMTLKKFFSEVAKNNIKNVAVDVRKNYGGDSSVIDEFISYLNVDEYNAFNTEIRYSKQSKEQNNEVMSDGYETFDGDKKVTNMKISDANLIFKGKIYIITSPNTFSGGNWFGVIFKDNKIGTIIGEPTGNKPSSYGDMLEFQMPNSELQLYVSYKKFVRPDSKNDENCLNPDILVYTKVDDLIKGKDPQMKKLFDLLN